MVNFKSDKHKALFIEFGLGVPFNILLGGVLYFYILPSYQNVDTELGRLIFALKCNVLPVLAMLIGLFAVALSRNNSPESDPLKMKESRNFQIHSTYLVSTHEQLTLFLISSLMLSVFLDQNTVRIIAVAAILFFINRILFWVGYWKDPLLRGFGLSGTLYPISLMILAVVFFSVKFLMGLC